MSATPTLVHQPQKRRGGYFTVHHYPHRTLAWKTPSFNLPPPTPLSLSASLVRTIFLLLRKANHRDLFASFPFILPFFPLHSLSETSMTIPKQTLASSGHHEPAHLFNATRYFISNSSTSDSLSNPFFSSIIKRNRLEKFYLRKTSGAVSASGISTRFRFRRNFISQLSSNMKKEGSERHAASSIRFTERFYICIVSCIIIPSSEKECVYFSELVLRYSTRNSLKDLSGVCGLFFSVSVAVTVIAKYTV